MLLATFLILLLGLPLLTGVGTGFVLFEAFYRAGALVFGSGHVVLPLLEESVVDSGWISANDFLAGYGAAQAVPGPMFSLAAYPVSGLTRCLNPPITPPFSFFDRTSGGNEGPLKLRRPFPVNGGRFRFDALSIIIL